MPLYTVMTQAGMLGSEAKARLAEDLTACHAELSGVPRNWVHVIFQDYPAGSGFTAGVPAATASMTVCIRTGRTPEYERALLKRLWQLFQAATGAPDDQLVIGLLELTPNQAMEMGKIMPDVMARL